MKREDCIYDISDLELHECFLDPSALYEHADEQQEHEPNEDNEP